ncbi:MAG: SUMF1/EgtB/PvdO family nonheme iron enzyme [Verrucomicrobiaceae bacterium]|nr:SUMF1/EgtB/PvdO family nonheme iron enzyme [Verrucomicrobiaceae bacterium]
MNTESDSGDDALAEGQTLKMSPDQMQALLAAGGQGVTRELRGWHPPSVEALQKMLPQYEIAEFIARGGMGAVYKGVQRALDRTVAIKILPPDIVEDGEANYVQRFKQEARAMAKFKHPGIVTVYDAGEVELGKTRRQGEEETRRQGHGEPGGSLLYFVMEFIEGTDVAHLVATHGQLPPEQAIRITTAVCDALAYAHARGVVHRDIKPSNIMIDADGQVKVADFGLAKITTHEPGGITKSSVTMGTPDFVAPETLIAGTLVDQRADIYAVGVMLYQMLTGHIPRGRFSPISAVVPKSDPKLDAIVDKAMQTDREKRYSSAVEMKADVESMTRSDGLQRPPSHAPAVANRRSLIFALAALLVIGFGGWSMLKRPPKPDASSALDLLTLVEVKRDAIYGTWQKTPAGLSIARTSVGTAGEGDPRVEFPFEVPVAYDYEMEFTPQDEGAGIKQIFSAGGRNGAWVMDFGEEAQPMMVLDRVSGVHPGSSAETTVKRTHRLTPGTRYRSRIEVREGELAFFLNDEPLLRWKGDFSQLSVDSAKALRSASHLGVAATQRDVVFHKITVQVATGDHALTGAATTPHGPRWSRMPTEEEKKLAFTNTLGMKFVPVPGTEVLFCIHETRKADYAAYAAGVPGVDATWRQPTFYRDTPVSPTPEHPVVWVSLEDAQGFCTWLTEKEGRKYRLPSDYEWSCAVGIAEREDREALPTARGAQFVPDFAWGTDWPPPKGAGNIGDETLKRVTGQEPVITGYDDGFATTAPVMSFPPNALGIHDLAGNVWEWCPDWFDSRHKHLVRRGSSYDNGHPAPQRAYVAACVRNPSPTDHRSEDGGFRIVAEKP